MGFWGIIPTIGAAASGLASMGFDSITKSIVNGLNNFLATLSALWLYMPSVNVGIAGAYGFQDNVKPFVMVALTISILIGASKMIWNARGQGQAMADLFRSLFLWALASGASVSAVALVVEGTDAFTQDFISQKHMKANFLSALIPLKNMSTYSGLVMFMIIGIIVFIVNAIGIVVMIFRSGLLVILTSFIPLAFSVTNTEWGKQWARKYFAWLLAFVFYKPIAVLIFSIGMNVQDIYQNSKIGSGVTQGIITTLSGIAILIMSVVALPALIKFLMPDGAMLGGGVAAGAAAGAAATGAIEVARMRQISNSSASSSVSNTSNTSATGSATVTSAGTGASGGATGGAAGGGAAGGGAAGGGAAAGGAAGGAAAAAGPAGAAVSAGISAVQKTVEAVKNQTEQATGAK